MLSFMASEFFQKSPMLWYPVLALAVFMLVFIFVTVKAALAGGQELEAMARLPLDSNDAGEGKESRHE